MKSIRLSLGLLFVIHISASATIPEKNVTPQLNEITLQQENYTLTGSVLDEETNTPMIGVNVYLKGTTIGTITGSDGTFTIDLDELTGTLVFSFIGYETFEIELDGNTTKYSVKLSPTSNRLDEIVVVATGYTKISKERATGAYSVIDDYTLEKFPVEEVGSVLEGISTGVQVKKDADGNITNVEIRGRSTVSSNAKPLIVVDGFPVEGDFSTINPNDVANITILKDAAAASIWGARAGNGVIVITTKKSRANEVQIKYDAFFRIGERMDIDYLLPSASTASSMEYQKWIYDSGWGATRLPNTPQSAYVSYNHVSQAYFDYSSNRITKNDLDAQLAHYAGIDFKEDINKYALQNAVTQQHNISLSKGGDQGSFLLSALYNDTQGTLTGNEREKLLINMKANYSIAKWINFDFSMMTEMKNSYPNNLSLSAIQNNFSPYQNLINSDGTYANVINRSFNYRYVDEMINQINGVPYTNIRYNPLQEMRETNISNRRWNNRLQAGLNIDILDGLNFRGSFQFEKFSTKNKTVYNEESFYVRSNVINNVEYDDQTNSITRLYMPKGGILVQDFADIHTFTFRNQVNYDKRFGQHQINLAVGNEVNWREREGFGDRLYGYNDHTLTYQDPPYGYGSADVSWSLLTSPSLPGRVPSGNYLSSTSNRFFSLYGNLAYTFNDRYTLSGSYRTDASNMIVEDPKYRYAPFWSIGASWNAKRENFLDDNSKINRLIARITYGVNGNIIPTASSVPLISLSGSPSNVTGELSARVIAKGNPTLRWEKVKQLNAGVDFALFNHAIFGSVDQYFKHSKDLLASISVPSTLGSQSEVFNAAEVKNIGTEIDLNYRFDKNDFEWVSGVKYSFNKSKVVSLFSNEINANYMFQSSLYQYNDYIEGYPYAPVFAWRYGGVDPETNLPLIVNDADPSTVYNMNSRVGWNGEYGPDLLQFMGTAIAPHVAGWTNTITYKNFTLQAVVIGKFGHLFRRESFKYYFHREYVGYYHRDLEDIMAGNADDLGLPPLPEGYDPTYYDVARKAPYLNSLVENASHIRLREIYLAYNLPGSIINKLGINNLKVYSRVQNPALVWTANDKGLDPEFVSGLTYKPARTYTFGLSVNF